MRKHPTSFTLALYKSNYRNLDRDSRVRHIIEPKYYLLSPDASSIGKQDDNPMEEGWKDVLDSHISNEFFQDNPRWINAMRQLSKSKLWDIVIAMLIEDASSMLKANYVQVRANRVNLTERVTIMKVLHVFGIKQKDYENLTNKLCNTIIKFYGFMPKKYEPVALKKYKEGTIFDLYLYGLADPQKNKMRFVMSEYYHSFQYHSKAYLYPLHATVTSPTLWVIKEQFKRINQEEILYKWLEDSLENRFGAAKLNNNDSYYIMHQTTIANELLNHKNFKTIESILSEDQLTFMFNTMKDISKVFNQVLMSGAINLN